MTKVAVVILAAGEGTRMKSQVPKVLHHLAGKPMVCYAVETATRLSADRPVLVVGYGADRVRQTVGEAAIYVEQTEQLGTGHAVLQTRSLLAGRSQAVLVCYADMPLLTADTLGRLVDLQQRSGAAIAMLTLKADDPMGFGRVVRGTDGRVMAVVEEAVATPAQLSIRELNAGVYCFAADWLWSRLPDLRLSPKGEYYLTDLIAIAVAGGQRVEALVSEDAEELLGINNRVHLARAEAIMRRRINEQWMLSGVTLVDPATTYIEATVQLSPDTIIYPNTYLQGATIVGSGCEIGPNTLVRDSQIGERCVIRASVVEGARVEDGVDIGPFSHLRKGAHLGPGVHIGNFGEIKNSYLGPGTKMGHFSYLGDATVGAEVNIGAGTITCNFDGQRKHQTVIEDGAFIGSDTMLVAPVRIGAGAKTGAGSVVTRDVPPNTLVYGVPARTKSQ
ncbi:MAG: bifunctional UDP-N-acetylglucosamine diphosphorylase/glucosamine-1-phosphate N-acetyltransferase GlmU [Anaerolineae bacterium]|nr:bifunctional UDP-N-acetylglucosamine diphosphorylase/glucosamine-1-phosphate N-acetyltransferase GlmU [Anaerolineae bacterium]